MRLEYDVAIASAISDGNWYGVQAGGFGGKNAGLGQYNYQPQFGFASRPIDATLDAEGEAVGCLLWRVDDGNAGGFAWYGHDTRYSAKCPPVTRGSSAQWNARGAFFLLDYDEETASLYVPIESGVRAHSMAVGKDANGKQKITWTHANKAHVSLTDDSVLIRHTGNGYIEVKGNDFNCNATAKFLSGIQVGQGTAVPLALATPLVAYLSGLETALQALATAIDGKAPSSPGVTLGVLNAALGALAASKASLVSTLSKSL